MSDPSLGLQIAIVQWLKADATVAGRIAGRVYDTVPDNPVFPYVTLGEGQTIPDVADAYDGAEAYVDLHVWSRGVGWPEAKEIAKALQASLVEAPLSIASERLVGLQLEQSRYLRDPDGLTRHVAMTFRALTESSD